MRRAGRKTVGLSAAILAVGLAGMVGVAAAKAPPTLGVFQSTVTNFMSPNTHTTFSAKIVGASGGFSVYTLTGDSRNHPQCLSKACRAIWPWVVVKNGVMPTKNPLIKAKLGIWKHNGVNQLTLGGHPLYFFFQDKSKKRAHGEGIVSFGGTWHVWKISSSTSVSSPMPTSMPNPYPTSMPTSTSSPTPYP
jgi:predicted lipoprotein with Yx(FWY)xxD motif